MKSLILAILASALLWTALHAQEADSLVLHKPRPEDQFMAADQSLMVMPTAYTMPKGASSFTNYELFIIQYSYGITSRTHLSAGMVFPIHEELIKSFTLGVKQNYYCDNLIQSALMASYNPHFKSGAFGNVVSIGNYKASLHGAAFWIFSDKEVSDEFAIMVGGISNISPRLALISEFITSSQTLSDEANGLFTIGLRFKGDKISWDIGGFRPISNGGDVILLPLLKGTFLF